MYGGVGSGEPSLSRISNSAAGDRPREAPVDVVVDERLRQRRDQLVRHADETLGEGREHQQLNASRQTAATASGSASP